MLMDLSKDIMMDLGITVIGDIIAILKHAKHVYRQVGKTSATDAWDEICSRCVWSVRSPWSLHIGIDKDYS